MHAWLSALILAGAPAASPPPLRCVQIVGTNDVHGHIEPDVHATKPGPSQKPLQVEQGGLAAFGGYLDILRARYPNQTLLIDGGDLFQGTVPSNLSKGAAVIAAYNALGYQAASLGNHEFDFGPEGGEADILGSIKQRLGEAKFPFLAANLYDRATGKHPDWKNLQPSVLLTVNGLKVGVIGAITPDTPTVTVPANVASLEFRNPAQDVIEQAAALRQQGAQLVVLVAHIGGECHNADPHEISSCNPKSELFQLLDALPAGTLDVAVGGHSHQYMAQFEKGVAVSEAGSYGASFGWVEACVDAAGKVQTSLRAPTDVCLQDWKEGGCRVREASTGVAGSEFLGEKVKPDPKVEKTLAPFLAKVKAQQEAPIGVSTVAPITRKHDAESSLGQLVARGIRAAVPGADFGVTNAGGIRADLPGGALTWGEVFEVLPFDNKVVQLTLTGKQVRDFLVAPMMAGHGYTQLAGGHLELDRTKPDQARVVLADGTPVDPNKLYSLATNDFMANGGDGTKPVMDGVPADKRRETGLLVRDAFLSYLKSLPGPVQAPPVAGAEKR